MARGRGLRGAGRRVGGGRLPHPRPLVIDESLNPRIATELKRRGRVAISVQELRLRGLADEPLLERLATSLPECVLVTADDSMPAEHGERIAELGSALATIDPVHPADRDDETWQWEVVQRWAHRMQAQSAGSIRRYAATRSTSWKPRRRRTTSRQKPEAQL